MSLVPTHGFDGESNEYMKARMCPLRRTNRTFQHQAQTCCLEAIRGREVGLLSATPSGALLAPLLQVPTSICHGSASLPCGVMKRLRSLGKSSDSFDETPCRQRSRITNDQGLSLLALCRYLGNGQTMSPPARLSLNLIGTPAPIHRRI